MKNFLRKNKFKYSQVFRFQTPGGNPLLSAIIQMKIQMKYFQNDAMCKIEPIDDDFISYLLWFCDGR